MTDNKLNFDQKNSLKSNELQILICHFYFQYMRVETKQNKLMWIITAFCISLIAMYYRPPGGGRLFDMKVVSSYVFLRTYYI